MPSKLFIKAAVAEDATLIAPLFDAYRVFYQALSDPDAALRFVSDRLSRGESRIFFACLEGETGPIAVGFTQLYPSFSSVSMKRLWILNDLYVAPEFRKAGVGAALMERARAFAKEDGAKGLSLSTQTRNLAAQGLYAKMGYRKETEFFQYHFVF